MVGSFAARSVAVVLFTTLVGCGGCGGPAGARYRFTADGTGPEGRALAPRSVGQIHSAYGFVKDGLIQLPSGASFREHQFSLETFTSTIELEAGLFVTGSTQDGFLEAPTLLVPSTVRVGMKWDVFLEGSEPAYSYAVTDRQENVDTVFGPATTWTIVQTNDDGTTASRVYAEGYGLMQFNEALIRFDVWPLEPQQVEQAPARPMALEPMVLPAQFAFTQDAPWIDAVSLVRVGAGPAALLVATSFVDSQQSARVPTGSGCLQTDGVEVADLPNDDGKPFRRTRELTCPRGPYRYLSPVVGEGPRVEPVVLHANGAWVEPDGLVTWVPREWTGRLSRATPDDYGFPSGLSVVPLAAMEAPDGGGNALHARSNLPDQVRLGMPGAYGDPSPANPDDDPLIEQSWFALAGEVVNLGPDAQGRTRFLLKDPDGMISWARLEGKRLSSPRLGGRLGGRLSVQARQGGADVLRITSDGSIDRLVLEGEELQLSHLADVTIPKGEVGVGAFALDERLLVATIAPGKGGNSLRLYRGTGSLGSGQTVRIPQALTLSINSMEDYENDTHAVCWRPNGEPVDLSRWTLDGDAPDLLVEQDFHGDTCVVIGLDARHNTDHQAERERVDAVIPGVGRVLFRPGTSAPGFAPRAYAPLGPAAVLSDGTLVTSTRRFGRGGLDLGLPQVVGVKPDTNGFHGLVDLGGAGLWATHRSSTLPAPFTLHGQTTRVMTLSLPDGGVQENPTLSHVVWPTGVAVNGPGGRYLVRPSGASEFLDGLPDTRLTCAVLDDGSHCGTDGLGYFCQAPGGAIRSVREASMNPSTCEYWIPLGDGTFLVGATQGYDVADQHRFDPVAMTLTPRVTGWNNLVGIGADHRGRGLVVTRDTASKMHLYLVTPTELVEQPVPAQVWTYGGNSVSRVVFTATPEVVFMHLFWSQGMTAGTEFRLAPPP